MESLNSLSRDQVRGGLLARHRSSQVLATFIQKEQKLGASSTKLDSPAHMGPPPTPRPSAWTAWRGQGTGHPR